MVRPQVHQSPGRRWSYLGVLTSGRRWSGTKAIASFAATVLSLVTTTSTTIGQPAIPAKRFSFTQGKKDCNFITLSGLKMIRLKFQPQSVGQDVVRRLIVTNLGSVTSVSESWPPDVIETLFWYQK